jgi:hypothetical protein
MTSVRRTALLPRKQFLSRVGRHAAIAGSVLLINLGVGMLGYHAFEGLVWVDAFANAAMILSGMGPLASIKTEAGKLFIGCYAIFSGVVFLTTVGFFLTPIVHRVLHRLHLESGAAQRDDD